MYDRRNKPPQKGLGSGFEFPTKDYGKSRSRSSPQPACMVPSDQRSRTGMPVNTGLFYCVYFYAFGASPDSTGSAVERDLEMHGVHILGQGLLSFLQVDLPTSCSAIQQVSY